MDGPLLETKFHVPSPVGETVARARLTDRLGAGVRAALTLVSAPAGFGKSTLLATLAATASGTTGRPRRVAWLSLDPGDNDPATFWRYVLGALDRASPGLGASAQAVLDGAPASVDAAITELLNALAGAGADVVLILDDFHAVESTTIHAQVSWFLDHLPANVHVVMGTRADPPMPLARLRARGALAEIRAADLRFSTDEAAAYLNTAMGLQLNPADVAALESRTEGWIAALQLAVLSLRGRADVSRFIEAFAGDDRYVVDYLVEEVLRRQPPDVRDFLLRTSILARMTGALTDALTGRDDGRTMLEALDRGNLFLVALDDQRRWYRYHHLFGDVLQAHLATELPGEAARLHRLAADWFQEAGDFAEAIRHAFESGDAGRAADLIERAAPAMTRFRREPLLRGWLDRLPKGVVGRRPVLMAEYAGALLSLGEIDGVEELLDGAERLLEAGDGTGETGGTGDVVVVIDRDIFGRLPALVSLYRAAVAKVRGDHERHLGHAQRVLDLVDPDDHLNRGGAAAFLGLAHWAAGELEDAERWYAEGMASLARAGRDADLVGGRITVADIRLAQGRLADALSVYEDGLADAMRAGPPFLRGVADMHVGIGQIRYERNDLEAARAALQEGLRLGEELGFPRYPYRVRVLQARLLQAEGDLAGAIAAYDAAERRYIPDYQPDVRPIAAQLARLRAAHGRPADARRWATGRGLALDDAGSYLHEYELLTLARLAVAEGAGKGPRSGAADAIPLLERLLTAADDGRRTGSVLEVLVVLALARQATGDVAGALGALKRAAAIAEPDGWVRVFLDEGPAMEALLRVAARARVSGVARLVAALDGSPVPQPRPQPVRGGLLEPLSERELDVLRLLRSELSGPEMAGELVVSLNTLRTHTRNIYAKLGVTSRRAAVRRAEELHLLS